MRCANRLSWRRFMLLAAVLMLSGCRQNNPEPVRVTAPPTPTVETTPVEQEIAAPFPRRDPDFIVIATDAPNPPFEDIDPFGNVIGFDPDVMASLAAAAGLTFEFVVTPITPIERVHDILADRHDFDAVMSALLIPAEPTPGITYTDPYLEVGQVLVIRANERALQSYHQISGSVPLGSVRYSSGEVLARQLLEEEDEFLLVYETIPQLLQALIDGEIDGAIIDSLAADHYTATYPQQLKIAGGAGRDAWIASKAYGIALAADNAELLEQLNTAIAYLHASGTAERWARQWLVPKETIAAGESLIGTPPNELVIGVVGQLADLDPAARTPDRFSWEVKTNTMSGLLMVNADNELLPLLAVDYPEISVDGLEYTFTLRSGLAFPDGRPFTANDVKWSIDRASAQGSWLVSDVLKKTDRSPLIDADAVQVIDPLTVKFVLNEPTAYFTSMLATPPFFIVSSDCFPLHVDVTASCGGIGPYTIFQWEPGEYIRLKANAQWPGPAPLFESVQVRFYDDPARMRRSLENGAIDAAWANFSLNDMLELRNNPELRFWEGPVSFKSYLVFEQSQEPWNDVRVRQAAAFAVNREALATAVFQETRRSLYSPVPDSVPGHIPSEPEHDLEQARALLAAAGYSADNPLEITIWYLNDGRYTPLEHSYAQAIKDQLEETGIFRVTLQGAPWDIFLPQKESCNYPAFLLGWPSIGWPPYYLDAMSWIGYFVTNTNRICSNYESERMAVLIDAAMAETDEAARLEIYAAIQEVWAEELPTLDLTQELSVTVTLPGVSNVDRAIDALGLLHYGRLTKGESR
jgi:peptide/nickel transport system substrate-binding protein